MLDTTLLQLFTSREKYEQLIRAVPKAALGEVTQVILNDYGKFFNEFPDVEKIEREPFWIWFKTFGHPKLNAEQMAKFEVIVSQITKPVAPEIEQGFTSRLVAAETALRVQELLENYNEGAEVNIGAVLRDIVDNFELATDKKVKTPWVRDDIHDLLADDESDRGFKWRLDAINQVMRPLIPGDFGIIAARPDVGKTTLFTDNLTHFAAQMQEVYPDQGRNILWFNNEGPGRRIKKRLYQSALSAGYTDLLALQRAGTLKQDYAKMVGGDEDIIRVFDVHDFWNWEVEDIIRQHNPGIIVFDMLDNIKFGGVTSNNGQRTDQLLEAMYQWGRVIGVKHDCVVLATSQISADGENLAYPSLSMLKDSKTGKQGAADFIMTVGYQSQLKDTRFLGLTKNKLAREGGAKTLQYQAIFDGQRGRYTAPTIVYEGNEEAGADPMEDV